MTFENNLDKSDRKPEFEINLLRNQLAELSESLAKALRRERGLLRRVEDLSNNLRLVEEESRRAKAAIKTFTSMISGHETDPTGLLAPSPIMELSPAERREVWVDQLSSGEYNEFYFKLFPHDGKFGDLRIVISGSGGIGDVLYLSALVRAVAEVFPSAMICVQHEHPLAREILQRNPYVSFIDIERGDRWSRLRRLLTSIDIFDLILEVRYAVIAIKCPISRVDQNYIDSNHAQLRDWLRFVWHDWPAPEQRSVKNGGAPRIAQT